MSRPISRRIVNAKYIRKLQKAKKSSKNVAKHNNLRVEIRMCAVHIATYWSSAKTEGEKKKIDRHILPDFEGATSLFVHLEKCLRVCNLCEIFSKTSGW